MSIPTTHSRDIIVFAGAIGDTLLAGPAIIRLARQAHVHLLGYPERLNLLALAHPALNITSLDAVSFSSLYSTPTQATVQYFRDAGRVVLLMNDPARILAEAITACGAKEVLSLAPLPPPAWPHHASDYYHQCLGFAPPAPPLTLKVSPTISGCEIILHPGSGSAKKNWPLSHYQELANALNARGLRVGYTTGPAEEGLTLHSATALPPMDLTQLASTIAGARLYIGNDSGITHLAAAAGCKTLALFGPTNPAVWAPKGAHVQVLHGQPWPTVAEVFHAALHQLGIVEPV